MLIPTPTPWTQSIQALAGLVLIVGVGAVVLVVALRRFFARAAKGSGEDWSPKPSSENPSAFMAASMQAVIQKLREQEKELERLHRLERERAQETERLSEAVTRNMPAGLLLVGATGAISSANPAAEAILGVHGLQYRGYAEVLGLDAPLARMIAACLHLGSTFQRGEIEHTTPSGEVKRLGVTISPILRQSREATRPAREQTDASTDEKVTGALCLMSDLTELTALQQQIRWKENLAALGEMAAGIAHEFKNSLATISGYAQMIRGESPQGDVVENAERILAQTRALTHVVTEFLRFARPLELADETVPVETLIEGVAEDVQESIPQVAIQVAGAFGEVPGDEGLLRQALLNLARNAAEAVAAGASNGRVEISGAVEEKGGRMWQRITIADNGPGIPQSDLTKVFLPFYTTKPDGTGMGLAVVQKIAVQHGGSVEARNRREGGAEFLLWLPLRQQTPAPAIASSQAAI
jgi:two-component system sensor histidine kinase HydH